VTLDSLNLNPKPTVLIVDLEGYEAEAIRGASRTIDNSVHSVLVEAHPYGVNGDTAPGIKRMLKEMGFTNVQIKETGLVWKNGWTDKWVLATKRKLSVK
jgi:hypothetical protein